MAQDQEGSCLLLPGRPGPSSNWTQRDWLLVSQVSMSTVLPGDFHQFGRRLSTVMYLYFIIKPVVTHTHTYLDVQL